MRHDVNAMRDIIAVDYEADMMALPHHSNPRIRKGDRLAVSRPAKDTLHFRVKEVSRQEDEVADIDVVKVRLIIEDSSEEDQPNTEAEGR